MATATTFEPWMSDHVHVQFRYQVGWANSTVYVATRSLSAKSQLVGGGVFQSLRDELRLTLPSRTASIWRLPLAFHPTQTVAPLTYHTNPKRWSIQGESAILSSVSRGQEFVVEANAGITAWIQSLFDLLSPKVVAQS